MKEIFGVVDEIEVVQFKSYIPSSEFDDIQVTSTLEGSKTPIPERTIVDTRVIESWRVTIQSCGRPNPDDIRLCLNGKKVRIVIDDSE